MSLYPSLEDMQVGHMMEAQQRNDREENSLPYPLLPNMPGSQLYPSLTDYMGLELSPAIIEANGFSTKDVQVYTNRPLNNVGGMVAPLSGESLGLHKAYVTNGIREVRLCKDQEGKVGLRLQAVNAGLFVALVQKDSTAAQAGVRFGDQVIQIMSNDVAGMTADEAHKKIKSAPSSGLSLVLRDRPFERTVTLHKDSTGAIGFQFKDGKIANIVKDSSAARNGLLIDHQLLEVNGQNVVGLKDKDVTKIITQADGIVTITIIPYFLFEHITKKMKTSLLSSMDHSVWY